MTPDQIPATIALKPCPFCGVGPAYIKHSAGMPNTQAFDSWHAVACKGCGATVGACDRRFRSKADAAAAWNTRPVQPSADDDVVAVIGADFGLFWIGSGPIAPIVEKHALRVGSKLYARPALRSEPIPLTPEQRRSLTVDRDVQPCRYPHCGCMHQGGPGPCAAKEVEDRQPRQHGVNCTKAPHTRDGYMHDEADDSPYNVDGVTYCGRCHAFLPAAPKAPGAGGTP